MERALLSRLSHPTEGGAHSFHKGMRSNELEPMNEIIEKNSNERNYKVYDTVMLWVG